MLCEFCLQQKATVQLTKLINSKKTTWHLCEDCASKQTKDLQHQFPQVDTLSNTDFPVQLNNLTNLIAQTIEKELKSLRIFGHFSSQVRDLLESAAKIAKNYGHNLLLPSHLLLAFNACIVGKKIFSYLAIDQTTLQQRLERELWEQQSFTFSPEQGVIIASQTRKVFEQAFKQASQLQQSDLELEHILLGIIEEKTSAAAKILQELGVTGVAVKLAIVKNMERVPTSSISGNKKSIATPSLDYFSTDVTALALDGKLDPLIGREKELERMIQILCRRTKNNPVLIGEPGVGKTAIVEGLAQKIIAGKVPELLQNKRVISLELASLVAGTKYRGEFEDRIRKVLDEIRNAKQNIILFIDELHTVVGVGSAEGTLDGANILKPDLAKGKLQCIGATTIEEYRKHIEKDSALERRFQTIMVEEPTSAETITILQGLQEKYETYHGVHFTKEALRACVQLSQQYINDRFLPDKAIDCMDEAAVRVRLKHLENSPEIQRLEENIAQLKKKKKTYIDEQNYEQAAFIRDEIEKLGQEKLKLRTSKHAGHEDSLQVSPSAVEEVIARWTNVPIMRIAEFEPSALKNLTKRLEAHIKGQSAIISSIVDTIRKAHLGLSDRNRPHASFLFLGPTGVGKTYLCKVLAEVLFGSQEALIRCDMSEYMEQHSVSKLIGSPPGYIGYDQAGQLTEKVRRRPYAVVLFDELEKAHHDVYNILLQILEDGRLTDAQGRKVSFKNAIVIATSNVGGVEIQQAIEGKSMGFGEDKSSTQRYSELSNQVQQQVLRDLKKFFNPEFIARLDEILFFQTLPKTALKAIVDLQLLELSKRLLEQDRHVSFTALLRQAVLKKGLQATTGARAIRREIIAIEKAIAAAIVENQLYQARSLEVSWDSTFTIRPSRAKAATI